MKKEPTNSVLPSYIRPQLRMFFSADIVGSTNYKQKNLTHSTADLTKEKTNSSLLRQKYLHPKWFAPIAEFYLKAEKYLNIEWDLIKNSIKTDLNLDKKDIGDAPKFWKAIGDEICFSKKLTSDFDVLACSSAWIDTVIKLRADLKNHSPELDIKATMWLAGFPITNTQVIFSSNAKNSESSKSEKMDEADDFVYSNLKNLSDYYNEKKAPTQNLKEVNWIRDFIGPSIDTGFRVSSLATPRKLMITVELAYMITDVVKDATKKYPGKKRSEIWSKFSAIKIKYEPRVSLKGVLSNTPYPVLYLDMEEYSEEMVGFNQAESHLLNLSDPKQDVYLNNLNILCSEYIKINNKFIEKPYIYDKKGNLLYGEVPENHKNRLDKLKNINRWFVDTKNKMENFNNDLKIKVESSEKIVKVPNIEI